LIICKIRQTKNGKKKAFNLVVMIIDVKQTTAIFKIPINFNMVPSDMFLQFNGIIPVDQIESTMEYNPLTVHINHCI